MASEESSNFVQDNLFIILKGAQELDFSSRVLAILQSNIFLGIPYGSGSKSSSSESTLITSDNIVEEIQKEKFGYSFERFDCVTFVEVVCSLALIDMGQKNISIQEQFESSLKSIRYKKLPACYMNSNHFTSADWFPNNARYFQEFSSHFEFKIASAQIKRVNFFVKKLVKGDGTDARKQLLETNLILEEELATLNYNELSYVLDNMSIFQERLPPISIAAICRPNWDLVEAIGSHLNVSHMGFVMNEECGLQFIHASTWPKKEVVQVPLYDYLKRFRNHETIKGISFYSL